MLTMVSSMNPIFVLQVERQQGSDCLRQLEQESGVIMASFSCTSAWIAVRLSIYAIGGAHTVDQSSFRLVAAHTVIPIFSQGGWCFLPE